MGYVFCPWLSAQASCPVAATLSQGTQAQETSHMLSASINYSRPIQRPGQFFCYANSYAPMVRRCCPCTRRGQAKDVLIHKVSSFDRSNSLTIVSQLPARHARGLIEQGAFLPRLLILRNRLFPVSELPSRVEGLLFKEDMLVVFFYGEAEITWFSCLWLGDVITDCTRYT